MLSLFPDLFDWSWYVPFFFRLFLAFYLMKAGTDIIRAHKSEANAFNWITLGSAVTAVGVLFLVGLFVQPAAIAGTLLAGLAYGFRPRYPALLPQTRSFYFLFALVSLSLLLLGPGPYAFDLPL